jgi:hypothetical protein
VTLALRDEFLAPTVDGTPTAVDASPHPLRVSRIRFRPAPDVR